ncbi:hypothetical protein PHJA_001373200 [Phtheirospermum japonicum]|uniref:S-protein homolog n=1 Tax=Phtheirospermum japonicum TaxID=374723 RepID=A0A830CDE5_9LAMI|nr:hypothetical protein PHJA_001373200 [Phtheirospermum japonicum]
MAYTRFKNFYIIIILSLYLINSNQAQLFKKHHVSIYNDLPQNPKPLFVRSQFKKDDLGLRTLSPGQGFKWSFNENLIVTTLFFCHFSWESQQTTFDVFNANWGQLFRIYIYVVKIDGFYENIDANTDHKTNFKKIRTW